MSDCKQLAEQYDAYALGALEGAERAEIAAHLERGCAECTQGVAQSRWLVSQLAYLAPEAEPPARLRERVVAMDQPGVPIRWRESRRVSFSPSLGWLAAAALLLFTVFLGYQVNERNRELAEMQVRLAEERRARQSLAEQVQGKQAALAVLASVESRAIALSAQDPKVAPFRAYWNEQLGLVLTARAVSASRPNRTLQLWVVPKKGNPISAGVFSPDASGAVVYLSKPEAAIADAAALAISDEPAGGSPQPTTTPIWVGPLGR